MSRKKAFSDESLPLNAKFPGDDPENPGLYWNGVLVANFVPIVRNRVTRMLNGNPEDWVTMSCLFENDVDSEPITLRISELDNINWFNLDVRFLLNPDCPKAEKYLATIIRHALRSVKVIEEVVIDSIGTHVIEGMPVFCTGSQLVWPPDTKNKPKCTILPLSRNLAVDPYLSEHDAIKRMVEVVNLTPDAGCVIFSHSLLGIMRSVFTEAGVTPSCIIYLVVSTGKFKTSYASFLTQIYDRDKGIKEPIRLNGTAAAAEDTLNQNVDCVVVLDDLFPAIGETKRKQEKTLIDLVRIIGDNSGRIRMKGDKVVAKEPRCGVIVTAEYLIGTGSDAARLLPIEYKTPIDAAEFHKHQSELLNVSTFYNNFIAWYVTKYSEIKDLLKDWLTENRNTDLGVHRRLQETHYCLDSAYKLFLCYCLEKGLTQKESVIEQSANFQSLLLSLVKVQNERVNFSDANKGNVPKYLKFISAVYKEGGFYLVKSIEKYKDKHDGVIHDNYLCLRGEKLLEKIRKFIPNTTLNDITKELLEKGALITDKDKRSKKIPGSDLRFYVIPLKKLR